MLWVWFVFGACDVRYVCERDTGAICAGCGAMVYVVCMVCGVCVWCDVELCVMVIYAVSAVWAIAYDVDMCPCVVRCVWVGVVCVVCVVCSLWCICVLCMGVSMCAALVSAVCVVWRIVKAVKKCLVCGVGMWVCGYVWCGGWCSCVLCVS